MVSCREKLYAFSLKTLKNHHDAEDAVQSAFCIAWEKLEQLRSPEKAEKWLFSILANHIKRMLGARRELLLEDPDCGLCSRSAEEEFLDIARGELLREALRMLPKKQREALYCCHYMGLKPAELARRASVSSHCISGRIYRGRKNARINFERLSGRGST